jgi:hypothetical protein
MNERNRRIASRLFSHVSAGLLCVMLAPAAIPTAVADEAAFPVVANTGKFNPERIPQLEKVFWMCDYSATAHGVIAAPVDVCAAAYEELKQMKFDGDFEQLFAWWKEHKDEEHARIAALSN